jgi:signal transduction histidine kinase
MNIEVSCEKVDKAVLIRVRDEGIGVEMLDQERLFERFYRIESPNTKAISGFGIGLYLSSEIIQRHKGKIWVESKIGEGSIFYFSLPTTNL